MPTVHELVVNLGKIEKTRIWTKGSYYSLPRAVEHYYFFRSPCGGGLGSMAKASLLANGARLKRQDSVEFSLFTTNF